jgi:4-amino-4-deoxychorismate lyase
MPTRSAPVLAALGESGPYLGDPAVPLVRADDLGVLRGESVFETMRAFGGRPFRPVEHLERMERSAAQVRVTLPAVDRLQALIAFALEAFGTGDGSVRLVTTKGTEADVERGLPGTTFALVAPIGAASERVRWSGIDAVTLTLGVPAAIRTDAPWLLGGVKSTSYATAMAALRAATERGGEDAVYVSSDGEVLEAPTASVVAVLDGQPVTPPELEVGILPGTSVGFFGESIRRRRLQVEELFGADEIMLLSSVRGVVPVLRLDGKPVGTGTVGPLADAMRGEYEAAVRALAGDAPPG